MANDLEIEGLTITRPDGSPSKLFTYQRQALIRAFDAPSDETTSAMFFNLGTGTGKTLLAIAGAQELFNRGEIDVCLMFAKRTIKTDFMSRGTKFSRLRFKQVEGTKPKRRKEYAKNDFDVLVLNYEKARESVDLPFLAEIVKGRRVLFCLDETQEVLLPNQARSGILELIDQTSFSWVWSLSASIINGNPERFWRVFEFAPENPLGTLEEFQQEYIKEIKTMRIKNKGRSARWHPFIEIKTPIWDDEKLKEVPEKVANLMVTGRKTDPGIRENFKGLQFFEIPLRMSPAHAELHELLTEESKGSAMRGTLIQYYNAVRLTCLHPDATLYSEGEISRVIADTLGDKLRRIENVKLNHLIEDVQTVLDGGDKCVVFTHWVNMSLNLISEAFRKAKIPHVVNSGGMKDSEIADIRETFRTSKEPMVFLSSDAGSHGINLPEARVVINYDIPTSYDTLMQRNDRIDRADSWLDGLEARAYFYEDTMEERIWETNNYRRQMAANMQGTTEILGRNWADDSVSQEQANYLLFGKAK